MKIESDFYKNLLDNLYDGIYFVDCDRKITYWNKGAERMTGYTSAEVIGSQCSDNILMHVDEKGINLCKTACPLTRAMAQDKLTEAEVFFHHKEGYRVPVAVRVTPIKNEQGLVIGAVEIFSDNTHKRELIQRLEKAQELALTDSLTGLGNRRYAEINLHTRFDQMQRYGWQFGLLFIDIDYFKKVNDAYGHEVGDKVLKIVGRTLLNSIRSFDILSRWGGEEFLAIVMNVSQDELLSIAHKLCFLVEQSSLMIDKTIIKVTVSVGATMAQSNDTMKTLLERVDSLMYQSKTRGRNQVST